MSKLRVFLNGCNGYMGRVVENICVSGDKALIVAGADINTSGKDYPVYASATDCKEDFDVIIDFSHVKALPSIFALAEAKNKPIIVCTTGLSEEDKSTLYRLSEKVPVFYSGNMSLGINVLIHLVKKAAEILADDFDLELVEAHHNRKVDAPSGTALMIADALNDTLDHSLEYVYDRHDIREPRGKKQLGIHAIRGGNIVGEHTVLFAGQEELLEIRHSAMTRDVFARGAVKAAHFIKDKPAGLYQMNDLIG